MNPKIHFLFTVSFLVFVSVSCKKELSVSMATSTSLSDKLVFAALKGENWKPENGA